MGGFVQQVKNDPGFNLSEPAAELGLGPNFFQGSFPELMAPGSDSLTSKYLRGDLKTSYLKGRRSINAKRTIKFIGAHANNLKNIDVNFPLGLFIVITGVSGSGKSTLVNDILYRAAAQHVYGSHAEPGAHESITGMELLDKVIEIDQAAIGRTPRSNPATYTGAFTQIRDWFAGLPEAQARGYKPGRFSFNVKGGRCEACAGDGTIKIEMHFLPDVYVTCEVCKGQRYNRETMEILHKGKSIADVLNMTVDDAVEFFEHIPFIKRKLETLHDVGLHYVKLGQSATTLSGGEAQRVKLSREISKRPTGRTMYILDEPTTGLHFADVQRLIDVLDRLVKAGNTVLVIEHNLDVIKTADWIVDLGPEGGTGGGRIVAQGTPEQLVKRKAGSHTAKALRDFLASRH